MYRTTAILILMIFSVSVSAQIRLRLPKVELPKRIVFKRPSIKPTVQRRGAAGEPDQKAVLHKRIENLRSTNGDGRRLYVL